MEHAFWDEVWESGRIPFHQRDITPGLERLWPTLNIEKGASILVPLCGKTLDMIWLRDQGYKVVGAELSSLAVEAFFAENNIAPTVQEEDGFKVFRADNIDIWCGDFFALPSGVMASCQGVLDRASFMALPEFMRGEFAAKLCQDLPAAAKTLMFLIEYKQEEMSGPPFSVESSEVVERFGGRFEVNELFRRTLEELPEQMKAEGLSSMTTTAFSLT